MSSRPQGRTPLAVRYLVIYAVAYLVLIALFAVIVDQTTRSALLDGLQESLETEAELAAASLPADEESLQSWAENTFEVGGFRTTFIRVDGVVLADSHTDPTVMENHAGRPEVVQAMTGVTGTATRTSASTGFEQLYVALPPEAGAVVRVSIATRVINDQLDDVRYPLLVASVVVGLLGVSAVALLARRTARPITELTRQSRAVAEGSGSIEVKRSSVREFDELGLAIVSMAEDLGSRASEAERVIEYLDVVLAALPEGTVLFGGDDEVTYFNPAAERLLGVVPEHLGEMSPFQCQQAVREARETNEQVERLVEHGRPVRRLQVTATPFRGDDRLLLTVLDMTDQERVAEVRRDFVANASHELKTPVTTIIASSEALQMALERDDGKASGFARQIEESVRQLDDLVGDLLDLSRLERDAPEMSPVRLDLLANDEVERARGLLASAETSLQLDGQVVTVAGSHRDLSIALRNLLDNAIRYTSVGSIEVEVGVEGGRAFVAVKDTGQGIPTRDIERVFERFFRVDTARARATGGTGLGLSIAKHITESHGGEISVESELGVGSTFRIDLPLP